jgi:phage-related protein
VRRGAARAQSEKSESDKPLKPIRWLSDSLRRLREFPEDVKDDLGAALFWAQKGAKHPNAKPLRGFGGAQILEIIEDYDGDTYRVVYTVRFKDRLYVLHAFQKKSKKQDRTPEHEMDLVRERLKQANRMEADEHRERVKS